MNRQYFSIGAMSDIGCVKSINQDNILVKIGEDDFGEFGLFVIADGMGGLSFGEVASSIVIFELKLWWDTVLIHFLKNNKFNLMDISLSLDKEIEKINNKVVLYGIKHGKKLGSTLSLLFIYKDHYIIKHIGDSRIYLIKDKLYLLTEDHSWVAEQLSKGTMSLKEAETHKNRNALTRCIGIDGRISIYEKIDSFAKDESFLLCSDGLYKPLGEDFIYSFINQSKNEKEWDLQDIAIGLLEQVKKAGAVDNVSLIQVMPQYEKRGNNILNSLRKFIKKGV